MEERTLICEVSREEEEGDEQGEEGGAGVSRGSKTEKIYQLRQPCSEPWSSRAVQTPSRPGVRPKPRPSVPETPAGTEEGSPFTGATSGP